MCRSLTRSGAWSVSAHEQTSCGVAPRPWNMIVSSPAGASPAQDGNLSLHDMIHAMERIATLSDREYRALARFRYALRVFQRFSEQAARDAGVTPAQHQLLLAVRGHPGGDR